MQFERTFDYELVRAIVTHPAVYPFLISDGAPARENYRPPEQEWNWYVLVLDDHRNALGLFWLSPYNAVCWEVHTCFLPSLRGGQAIRAYREALAWLWKHSPCRKVIGNIGEDNKPALAVALRAGLTIIGRNTKSIQKQGRLIDQIIVGKGSED